MQPVPYSIRMYDHMFRGLFKRAVFQEIVFHCRQYFAALAGIFKGPVDTVKLVCCRCIAEKHTVCNDVISEKRMRRIKFHRAGIVTVIRCADAVRRSFIPCGIRPNAQAVVFAEEVCDLGAYAIKIFAAAGSHKDHKKGIRMRAHKDLRIKALYRKACLGLEESGCDLGILLCPCAANCSEKGSGVIPPVYAHAGLEGEVKLILQKGVEHQAFFARHPAAARFGYLSIYFGCREGNFA